MSIASSVDKQLALTIAAELGAPPSRLQQIRSLPLQQAVQAIEQLKVEVKKAAKKLALKYHPDRNPTRVEWATERFKTLMAIVAEIEALRVVPRRPPVQQWAPVQWVHTSTTTATTTATFHGGYFRWATEPARPARGSGYDARRVVFIHVT